MLEPQQRLRNAVIQGNLPLTKRLLARFPELWLNVDPNYKGWSNLHFASYHGNYLICFHLISFINKNLESIRISYSQLDLLTFDRLSVLHLALIKHHSQTLHYLLQEFPGQTWLNFPGGNLEQTPLHYACIHGFEDGVKLLLEFGGDWKIQDKEGNTCLHYCFQYGSKSCIKSLFRFILQQYEKPEAIAVIKKFEKVKNKKGWQAVDFAATFKLIGTYQSLKDNLFAHDYYMNNDISSTALYFSPQPASVEQNEVNTGDNKVLSSQILSVLQQSDLQDSDKNTVELDDRNRILKSRAHSQSLPDSTDPLQIKPTIPHTRNRSQTTANSRAPNLVMSSVNSPRTPTFNNIPQFTPLSYSSSVKSVTISPSVRNNSSTRVEAPPSPQSSYSSSPMMNSPFHNMKRTETIPVNPFSPLKVDTEKWPSVSSSSLKEVDITSPNNISRFESYNDANSVPVYFLQPFIVTSTTPSPKKQTHYQKVRSRSSSSTSSLAMKLPNNGSRTSLGENGTKSLTPHLRKSTSINGIRQNTVEVKSSRSSSISAIPVSQQSDVSPKKSSISNVSFSRIR